MAGLTGLSVYFVDLLVLAGIYAIVSLGLNLQWGYTGLFNIAVAGFWAIGAYTAALVSKPAAADTAFGFNLPYLFIDAGGIPIPFPSAVVIAAIVSGVIALLIGIPTLRLRADYLAIASLGLAEIIRIILLNEAWLAGGAEGMTVQNPLQQLDYTSVYLLIVTVIFLGAIYLLLQRAVQSPWGRVLHAIRDDEDVAQASGKNTFSFKMQSFVIGSMIMGAGGALTALRVNFLIPKQFIPESTFLFWIAVIVGGSGNNRGALLGGGILVVLYELPRFIADYVPETLGGVAANFRFLSIGLALIFIMTYRPWGILGDPHVIPNE